MDFKCIKSLKGETNKVLAVQCISSSLLTSGKEDDGNIDILDLDKNSIVQQLRGHTSSVRCFIHQSLKRIACKWKL